MVQDHPSRLLQSVLAKPVARVFHSPLPVPANEGIDSGKCGERLPQRSVRDHKGVEDTISLARRGAQAGAPLRGLSCVPF
jgi:hypothetical protein